MAGNEKVVASFLFRNCGVSRLAHLGLIEAIGLPIPQTGEYRRAVKIEDVDAINSSDRRKKADIYINGVGVSIKQSGGSNLFNRIQRHAFTSLLDRTGVTQPDRILASFDSTIHRYHIGALDGDRNRLYSEFNLTLEDFKKIVEYLTMRGSPIEGDSQHPASYILTAPARDITEHNIIVQSFDEFFNENHHRIRFAIRASYYGCSGSEHRRAAGLITTLENGPWIFDCLGLPRQRGPRSWRAEIHERERRATYFIMVELLAQ